MMTLENRRTHAHTYTNSTHNKKIRNLKQKNKRKRFNLERLILSVFGIIFNSMTWLINMYCAKCNRNGANM